MSGGSFDYAFGMTERFADELGVRLDQHDKVDEWGCTPNKFEPQTLAKLREIERLARRTAQFMKEAEWLYSGDTGDDSFMERVKEIESSNVMSPTKRRVNGICDSRIIWRSGRTRCKSSIYFLAPVWSVG